MTDITDYDEDELRKLSVTDSAQLNPPPASDAVALAVKQANVQTGGRDLLTLAVSSFFAALLLIFSTMTATALIQKKHFQHKPKDPH